MVISFRLLTVLCLVLLVAACEPAQQAAPPAVDLEAEKATVTTMTEHFFELLAAQNFDQIKGMATDDWVFFGTDQASNLDAMREDFTHMTDHTINLSNIEVMVSADATLAVATCDEDTQYKQDGEPLHQKAKFTLVYQKSPDGWKLGHVHRSSTNVVDEAAEM